MLHSQGMMLACTSLTEGLGPGPGAGVGRKRQRLHQEVKQLWKCVHTFIR